MIQKVGALILTRKYSYTASVNSESHLRQNLVNRVPCYFRYRPAILCTLIVHVTYVRTNAAEFVGERIMKICIDQVVTKTRRLAF